MIYVSQIIMLYPLNLYIAVCQLYLNKTGRGKKKKSPGLALQSLGGDLILRSVEGICEVLKFLIPLSDFFFFSFCEMSCELVWWEEQYGNECGEGLSFVAAEGKL